uniref:WD repeat domain 90 n=1 Tax=Astatotilapia calliptera TaxID=8154 RepID=A0A3P8PJE8_ASTCA
MGRRQMYWQHPYVNIFKYVRVEEWKRSAKEGDVSAYTDKTLKCPVFRIRSPVPANSFILLPKNSSQSLGLTGRFFYLLFRPTPGKYFVVHLDVAAGVSSLIWLHDPLCISFIFAQRNQDCLVGPAPTSVRWTCLMLDLQLTLSDYLSRSYSHLKNIKLCANMTVKNMFTSDLLLDPGVSFSQAKLMGLTSSQGTGAIPREMSFPVPKGGSWHDLYDYIRYSYRYSLLPDPILRLNRIIGFGGATFKCALWSKSGDEVVYPCHAIIVSMKISSNQQRFFIGHTDKVSALAFNGNTTLLASAQTGNNSVVRVWNYHKANCVAMFRTHAHSLSCLSFSYGGGILCGVGKDKHNKTMVVVWNTLNVSKGGEVSILAKTHTDVDIHTMKVAFFDDTRMVSCGRGNIRLWRVRNGTLRSCPVNLDEYQTLDFTDKCETNLTPLNITRSGHIFEIDYSSVVIKNVRRLLPAQTQHADRREKWTFNTGPGIAINSISVSSSFCATGSEDGFLRLWPFDFSTVFLEAEHEGPVSTALISFDSLRVLAATSTGNLGFLDVSSRGYNTLMRSHTDTVLGFSVDGIHRHLTTASSDGTVRIWNMDSLHQLYDFVSEDSPCSVAFHPGEQIFSCGFSSGMVRVFAISSAKLLADHKYHRGEVVGLAFSPDGEFMYSADSQGSLALYNSSEEEHSVIKVVCILKARAPDALTVSSDSRCLAFVGPSEYTVTVADARTLDELLHVDVSILDVESPRLDSALKVCFPPASTKHLLVATSGNKILWVCTKTGRLLRELSKVHKHYCSSLAVSDDGRFLLTAGHNAVKVWDYNMQLDINSQVMFIGHSHPIRQLSFTPDQLGVISVGDAIFLWDFLANPVNSTAHIGLAILYNNLTDTEVDDIQLSNGMPRKTAPLPSSPPPRLDISSIDRVGHRGKFVFCSSASACSSSPEAQEEGIRLKAVIGYNGNGRGNMVWSPDQGLFAYSCGCVVVVEDLHTGSQRHLQGHREEISCLAVTNDAQTIASAGGTNSSRSLISIWDVQSGTCRRSVSYHSGAVQCLAFSRDDCFFLSVGDFSDPEVALWSSRNFQMLSSVRVSGPVHDAAFSPSAASQMACVGTDGVYFCFLHTQGQDADLKVQRVKTPAEVGDVELTALCYHMDDFLFTGTNRGHVCTWDVRTQRCLMTWEADEGEIGVLLCRGNRLLTGSNTRWLRLWEVEAVQSLKAEEKGRAVVLAQEIMLDGATVSASFDNTMDMGIVGTTAGTLWYINWSDNSNIRLVSGHKTKVNDVAFSFDESHFATCSEDGSVRVWSTSSYELVVQFQVLNQACDCVCWSPFSSADSTYVAGGYSDGTVRIFRLASTEMEMKLHPHHVAISAIQYSANGHVILSAGKNGLVAVSSPVNGATIRVIKDHKGAMITTIQCVIEQCENFGLEGNDLWLATSADRRVSVWAADWMKDKCNLLDWLSFPGFFYPSPSNIFCSFHMFLVVYTGYGVEKELSFYSLTKKQIIKKISFPHWATCISLSSKSHLVAVGSHERVLKLIKSTSGRFQDFLQHSDSLQTCQFSPSGTLLFSVAYNEILLWEVRGL